MSAFLPKAAAPVERAAPCEPAWEVDAAGELFIGEGASLARIADAPAHEESSPAESSPGPGPAVMPASTAERIARGVLVTVLEVIDGRRAPATVSALLEPGPMAQVVRLAKAPRRPADAAQVRTVQIALSPTKKAHTSGIEVCATYARGRRLFAVAAHLEAGEGRVRCTGLRMPS